ncbi:MAG: decarboxylase [Candidatus Woesearchaeota archaeon]
MKKAYFELSKKIVIEQYKKIVDISDIVSYSSKTNPHITKILEKYTNCLFSMHLENELKNVADKSRVLFLVQGWTKNDIIRLLKKGVKRFVVDNTYDLEVLESFLEKNDAKIDLMLRVKLKENTIRTERYFVFGMNSETINKKIPKLRQNKKIVSLGIHFHRKTQNMAEWNLKYEIENMFGKGTLASIDVINIGGGLPSEYANTNVDVISSILKRINDTKKYLNKKNIKMMTEPGRFIAAPAVKLRARIVAIYENNIIVNASVYNSDMDAIIVPVKLRIKGEFEKSKGKAYAVKGITPCSLDLFRYRVYLDEPKIGDELVFLNAGAYNFTSDFCDLEKLNTVIVD